MNGDILLPSETWRRETKTGQKSMSWSLTAIAAVRKRFTHDRVRLQDDNNIMVAHDRGIPPTVLFFIFLRRVRRFSPNLENCFEDYHVAVYLFIFKFGFRCCQKLFSFLYILIFTPARTHTHSKSHLLYVLWTARFENGFQVIQITSVVSVI